MDLEQLNEQVRTLPASFVLRLQYNWGNGFSDDYTNVVTRVRAAYGSVARGNKEVRDLRDTILSVESYQQYLLDRQEGYNEVGLTSVSEIERRYAQRKGFSCLIRSLEEGEVLAILYHEKARERDGLLKEFQSFVSTQEGMSFQEMSHRRVFTFMRDIVRYTHKESMFEDIDKMVRDYGP